MVLAHYLLLLLLLLLLPTAEIDAINVNSAKGDKGRGSKQPTTMAKGKGGKASGSPFAYGVASGDPLATAVILWTAVSNPLTSMVPVSLAWEVSTDVKFRSIVVSGKVTADSSTGHTAKVDVTGLSAGTEYWYRFKLGNSYSPVGITRTLPDMGVNEVKLAVFSCSNYPAGYFHVYKESVKRGAQFAVHLGDYIYEYKAYGYASDQAAAMGRKSEPDIELTTLDNYRKRHAQYKSDPDSQLMHAAMPMISVWDDHESANDAYRDGAQNHDPNTEGTWTARKAASIQAYHEWMPIRTGSSKEIIYRSFDFGDLISLHMLDTRLIGRDKVAGYTDPGSLFSPTRELLGKNQSTWLQERFTNSPGQWQILGQQVLMSRMEIPVSILQYIGPDGVTNQVEMFAAVNAYLAAKAAQASGNELDLKQEDLLDITKNPKLGYNLDAWDGYPVAREKLLNFAASALFGRNRQLVVLAGDTHNAWYANITAAGYFEAQNGLPANTLVGTQLATASVSSPGFERSLSTIPSESLAQTFRGIIDDLKWMDAYRRGFILLTVTPAEMQADWIFVSSVLEKNFTSEIGNGAKLKFDTNLFSF